MIAEQTQFGLTSNDPPFSDDSEAMLFVGTGAYKTFSLRSDNIEHSLASVSLRIHQSDLAMAMQAFARSSDEMIPLKIEFRAEHPEIGELWIRSRAVPVKQVRGHVVWHGFFHDITSLKLTETQLLEKQNKLRELVASRESLREGERTRIAWEMHEDLGQMLVAMKMRVNGIRAKLPNEQHSVEEDSREIIGLIDQSILAIRGMVSDLRPAVLEHGTSAALEWLVSDFKEKTGKKCELQISANDENSVSDQMTTQIFRIAQEALEYAGQSKDFNAVAIAWSTTPKGQTLKVWHDGSESVVRKNSLIFLSLEERVQVLDGVIQVYKGENGGVNIEVWLPNM
jgi:signal transduction histidine kinase